MLKQVFLCLTLYTLCNLCPSEGALQGFENGQYYTISSAATGKYMSAGGKNFSRSATVVATDWSNDPNQKWLALEAPFRGAQVARDVQSVRFYLISRNQQWDWAATTNNGSRNFTVRSLPPLTEALALDSLTGNLTTEVFSRTSSSQQWIAEDAAEGRIFIRNLGNNQCIKNFDHKPGNLLQKLVSFISRIRRPQKHSPNALSTLDCAPKDISEKWIAEQV